MSVSSKQPFSFDLLASMGGGNSADGQPKVPAQAPGPDTGHETVNRQPRANARRVCVRIPPRLYDSVREIADAEETTVTDIIVQSLRMRVARPDLFARAGESR